MADAGIVVSDPYEDGASWTLVKGGGGAPPADETPPTVSDVSPAAGSALKKTDAVAFSVTDDTGEFVVVAVYARFAVSRLYEVVHDGEAFGPRYGASTREAIAGGYRYTLRRTDGWPEAPRIRVKAFDRGGNPVELAV